MNNSVGFGLRLVLRVVLLQIGCAACGAAFFGCVTGLAAGGAALLGGLIVAIGSALFAAESLKWFWYVLAVWLALARLKVQPLPLMAGLVFAQFGYWVGMVGMKRP